MILTVFFFLCNHNHINSKNAYLRCSCRKKDKLNKIPTYRPFFSRDVIVKKNTCFGILRMCFKTHSVFNVLCSVKVTNKGQIPTQNHVCPSFIEKKKKKKKKMIEQLNIFFITLNFDVGYTSYT